MVFDILADGVRFELYSPAAAKADPDHFALTRRTPLNAIVGLSCLIT
jgi:hypothetical protein